MKTEGKTSSLRSVRVKPERMRDKPSEKPDNESPVKTEPPEDNKEPKPSAAATPNNMKQPVPNVSRDTEPLTTAVAPFAQETTPSDCKEEVLKTEEAASAKVEDDDVIEVPYKPKSPEAGSPLIQEVKRRKLDILKEGGLEVTPVTSFVASKEVRPSVIQQAAPRTDSQHMPPPPSSAVPMKRQIPLVPVVKPPSFDYLNGQSPPKVVQSKSIYSYSEKTVYGNPRDVAVPPLHPVHSPRVGIRQSGGDVLDLRVTSPQKPVVEIVRVPSMPNARDYGRRQLPLIEGRKIGSNLEITLVGPQKAPYSVHNHVNNSSANKKFTQKRTLSEGYANSKHTKLEGGPSRINGVDLKPPQATPPKQYPVPPPVFPGYLPLLQTQNKPFLPMMDPLYLSALQSVYSPPNQVGPAPPPIFPMATPEQLQLYSELMAHNARARFPFPFPDVGTATNENKKL